MKIGIIGSGNVGGTLGSRWAQAGHQVTFGSRTPEQSANAPAATLAETVAANDVLLLSTPWDPTEGIVKSLNLAGKIVIDATNPLLPKLAGLTHGNTTSGAEQVAEWAPGAHVVKAFNTIGANVMENPAFPGGPAVLFYCGDDAAAKQTVHQLATDLGFDPHDGGPLKQARLLEPFALLWISLAFSGYGRDIAFSLLRR